MPFTEEVRKETLADFRGKPAMYEARGFDVVDTFPRNLVVRRAV